MTHSFLRAAVRSLILLGASLTVGACTQLPQVGVVPVSGLDTANPQGVAPALDIQNNRGPVRVIVNPEAKGISVRAIPVGGEIEPQSPWTAASMELDNNRPVLRVLSSPQDTGAPDVPVELTVTMPRIGGVRVQNGEGPVSLQGVRGAVEVYTTLAAPDGTAITIDTRHALTDPVLLRAGYGDIHVRMGRGSAGLLHATSGRGGVVVDAGPAKVTDVHVEHRSYRGTLNGGANEHRIATEAGDVLVSVGLK